MNKSINQSIILRPSSQHSIRPLDLSSSTCAMPFSHHSHSGQFCGHATNTLEEVVQKAIALKFQVFALTEHMPRDLDEDLYPEEVSSFPSQ